MQKGALEATKKIWGLIKGDDEESENPPADSSTAASVMPPPTKSTNNTTKEGEFLYSYKKSIKFKLNNSSGQVHSRSH